MLSSLKLLIIILLLSVSVVAGIVEPTPFLVSKVAPAGNYTTKEFKELWEAFRDQYRIDQKGVFIQHAFARQLLARGFQNDLNHLFYRRGELVSGTATSGEKPPLNPFFKGSYVTVKTVEDARDYVITKAGRVVTVKVTNRSSISHPGALECVLLPNPLREFDHDSRDLLAPVGRGFEDAFFIPANPVSVVPSQITCRVYKQDGCYVEIARLPDTKANQDSFVDALKAGSAFRVYTFKDGACWNCVGFVRNMARPCEYCSGTGRLPLGYISVLVWDAYVPKER